MVVAAEYGHDGVTDELIDIAALGNDLLHHYIEIFIQQLYDRIGRFSFADGSKTADIDKDYRASTVSFCINDVSNSRRLMKLSTASSTYIFRILFSLMAFKCFAESGGHVDGFFHRKCPGPRN